MHWKQGEVGQSCNGEPFILGRRLPSPLHNNLTKWAIFRHATHRQRFLEVSLVTIIITTRQQSSRRQELLSMASL